MDIIQLNKTKREAAEKNEKNGEYYVWTSNHVKCTRCGIVPKSPESAFFKKSGSVSLSGQKDYLCVCKTCAEQIFNDYVAECGNDDLQAVIKFCAEFNYYYDKEYAKSLIDSDNMKIGKYLRYINMKRKSRTFADNYIDIQKAVPADYATQLPQYDSEAKWTIEDKKNRDSVISRLGYDPFADSGHTDEQLRFLYNTFAGYLTDAVEQDSHKLQNVLMMVKTFLQLEIIDKNLDMQLNLASPDMQLVTNLTNMKEKLSRTATTIANENGFAAKTGARSAQGANTFSEKQKEMLEKKFSLSKVNIHDIRMAESFKEISKLNAHALIEEMNLTGDDYARLCAEQREFVTKLQDENEGLEEENRLLRIQLKEIQKQKK